MQRFADKLAKMRAVNVLLIEGTNRLIGPQVKTLCAQALANLSTDATCRRSIVREDFVTGMKSITASVDVKIMEDCAAFFYNLANDPACHRGLVENKAIKMIVHMVSSVNTGVVTQLGLSALCTISQSKESYEQFVLDGMGLIATTIQSPNAPRSAREDSIRMLCNLVSFHPPARKAAVAAKCIGAVADYSKSLVQEDEEVAMVARIIKEVSECEDSRQGMIQVKLLCAKRV